jgi:nucleotide-binding universal stress UspA family protein
MVTPGNVLVGADGSEGADNAVRWAAKEAERRNTTLHILHAYDDSGMSPHVRPDHKAADVARDQAERIAAHAKLIAHDVAPRLVVRSDAGIGDPSTILLDAAGSAALVVVGSRGRGGLVSALLGSISQRVVTHAVCPTVVVRGRSAPDGAVVVGADGSPAGAHAVGLAFEEAAARACPLIALHAYVMPVPPWHPGLPPLIEPPGQREAVQRRTLDDVLAPWREKFPQVAVEAQVTCGDPVHVLIAASRDAQLVVVGGRAHASLAGTVLGSVGLKLLHHAACPVAIAHG